MMLQHHSQRCVEYMVNRSGCLVDERCLPLRDSLARALASHDRRAEADWLASTRGRVCLFVLRDPPKILFRQHRPEAALASGSDFISDSGRSGRMSSMDGPDPIADLPRIGSVPVGTEYLVRRVAVSIRGHERAHIFPDNVAPARHFDEAPPLTLANQASSAGEALCT